MKIKMTCECGTELETSTVYDAKVCMNCGKSHEIPKNENVDNEYSDPYAVGAV